VGIMMLKKIIGNVGAPLLFATSVLAGLIIYIAAYYFKDKNTFLEVVSLIRGN